ncbi:MAG: DUF5361 domain-containing protein [Eubacteriales bacterium]|nr:DUF5361 domain-containing protein [Eubacteriales bacterium]
MAETYGIYDYHKVPPLYLSTLVAGLGEGSRVSLALSGSKVSLDTLLLATIADDLNLLMWSLTRDGGKGRNQPRSIVELLTGHEETKDEPLVFATGKDFEEERQKLLRNVKMEGV